MVGKVGKVGKVHIKHQYNVTSSNSAWIPSIACSMPGDIDTPQNLPGTTVRIVMVRVTQEKVIHIITVLLRTSLTLLLE